MKITDLNETYYDPNQDQMFRKSLDDVRTPVLTLRAINRMKKIRATKKLEDVKRTKLVSTMYGGSPAEDDGF